MVQAKILCVFCAPVEPEQVHLAGELSAIEGQDLKMTCFTSSSNPPAHIRWWLGNKEVNATAVITEEVSQFMECSLSVRLQSLPQCITGLYTMLEVLDRLHSDHVQIQSFYLSPSAVMIKKKKKI